MSAMLGFDLGIHEISKIIARPLSKNEPDLLIGMERHNLVFADLAGTELVNISAPGEGWTHDTLEASEGKLQDHYYTIGWDAFLINDNEKHWVGSSEI